jgi:hypothetical protein
MSTTPRAQQACGECDHAPQNIQHGVQALHPLGIELHVLDVGHGGNRLFERGGALRRTRIQRGGHDEGVGQGIVGQRIERLAEPRTVAKLQHCLLGRDDPHRSHVAAKAQLLGERNSARGTAFLSI